MIVIPIEILNLHDDGFHVLVEVVAFNKPFIAVVDTGASRTVLDKDTVKQYVPAEALMLSDKLSTGLGTSSMESYTLTIPQLLIGDLEVTNFKVAVLDLSTLNTAYQTLDLRPVIGVVGGDILMKYQATISYPAKTLSLLPDTH